MAGLRPALQQMESWIRPPDVEVKSTACAHRATRERKLLSLLHPLQCQLLMRVESQGESGNESLEFLEQVSARAARAADGACSEKLAAELEDVYAEQTKSGVLLGFRVRRSSNAAAFAASPSRHMLPLDFAIHAGQAELFGTLPQPRKIYINFSTQPIPIHIHNNNNSCECLLTNVFPIDSAASWL